MLVRLGAVTVTVMNAIAKLTMVTEGTDVVFFS